ncbi:MAG TPA: aldehyde dehydrogenase (NADP(+)) [Syntrophales bacterium]|nr:aldehyde dehydrogenase (NADP(+)) [Syntrophales bacterium]HPQ43798.1 aldehyde dehydrogenase (NADP(+)) [Syntrophales bacterium]
MSLQPVLIAGEWRQSENPVDSFTAFNPAIKSPLEDHYPVSGMEDVESALMAARAAVGELRTVSPGTIAGFLRKFAQNIEDRAETLIEMANQETALPLDPRLRSVELPRTVDQLRQAATAACDQSWCQATIDTKTNIRSHYGPLGGPVIVFGPNNFPFAFNSAAGGDFAAAIAVGNPVIAKANTGHPGTTKLFAQAAFDAVRVSGLPGGMVQLLYRTPPDVGFALVSHPLTGATGFTGSKSAGLTLKAAADKAGKPIYLEMSSINPVFILPGALEERLTEVAGELYASCSLGGGQFCTNPGLVVVQKGGQSEAFIAEVSCYFEENPAGTLLGPQGPGNIANALRVLRQHGAEVLTGGQELDGTGYAFANTLLRVSGDAFLANPKALQTEAYGTVSLIVCARDDAQMEELAEALEGSLTGCIYSHTEGHDDPLYDRIEPVLIEKVGRLLNDKMPTGVAVSPAMHHGGPYPATGHPGFTAVGIPASMLRFAARRSYDNVRQHRLPSSLLDKNPTGSMWRFIDLEWTQRYL